MDDLHRRLVKNALPRGLQNLHTMHAAIRIQGHRQAQAARYSPLQCFLGVMTVAGLLNTCAPLVQISCIDGGAGGHGGETMDARSEEHTSELQSRGQLVCRLLLENTRYT